MLTVVLMSLTGARMLQNYSSRMVNNMWILRDGKNVKIEFLNAFFVSYGKI